VPLVFRLIQKHSDVAAANVTAPHEDHIFNDRMTKGQKYIPDYIKYKSCEFLSYVNRICSNMFILISQRQ
jgi:hypothetical protein